MRDGVTMYFASTRAASTNIYVSKRSDAGAPFGPPQPVRAFNVARAPFILAGAQIIYFTDDYDNLIYTANPQGGCQRL